MFFYFFFFFSYPDVTVIQQMQEEQQSQPRPSPVHTPLWSQSPVILTPPAHQLHSPQNCESSQNTSQDP